MKMGYIILTVAYIGLTGMVVNFQRPSTPETLVILTGIFLLIGLGILGSKVEPSKDLLSMINQGNIASNTKVDLKELFGGKA